MTPVCPSCTGLQMVGHPGGVLMFRHALDCPLLRAEDATQANDSDYAFPESLRPTTVAERTLLAAVGAPLTVTAAEDLQTQVEWITGGTRRRTWPAWAPTDQPQENQ